MIRFLLQFVAGFVGAYLLFRYLEFDWAMLGGLLWVAVVTLAFLHFWPRRFPTNGIAAMAQVDFTVQTKQVNLPAYSASGISSFHQTCPA